MNRPREQMGHLGPTRCRPPVFRQRTRGVSRLMTAVARVIALHAPCTVHGLLELLSAQFTDDAPDLRQRSDVPCSRFRPKALRRMIQLRADGLRTDHAAACRSQIGRDRPGPPGAFAPLAVRPTTIMRSFWRRSSAGVRRLWRC